MPTFPRHQSQAQLTTQATSVQAPEDTSGQILEKVSEAAAGVSEAALKWSNAVDTVQRTTALANFKTGMLDIQNRAANDPNYNNSDEYYKEIEKLRTDSLKGFSSKAAETAAALELNYESRVGKIQVENLYKKKMIDVGQTSTLRLLDMESQTAGPNTTANIRSILNAQVQAGVFSMKDAYELEKKYIKDAKYNAFMADLGESPAQAAENLTKNVYEFDVKDLAAAQKVVESQTAKIQAVTENQVLSAYLEGDAPTELDIKQLMVAGKIDAKFAESMIKRINERKPDVRSQDLTYIDFQNRLMDLQEKGDKASTQELVKFMTDTMQAHAANLLDKSDVERILKDRNELVQNKLGELANDVLSKKNPKTWLQRISFWSDEYAKDRPEIKARMYRRLVDGMMQGGDPDEVMVSLMNDEMNIHLTENLKKTDRQYAVSENGKRRIYSDDGGATWFDEKTGKEVK